MTNPKAHQNADKKYSLSLLSQITMINQIDILSPGKGCHKTRRLQEYLEKFVRQYGIDAKISIITDMKTMLTYRSWILPAVFINGKPVARGYRPSKENLFKHLKKG